VIDVRYTLEDLTIGREKEMPFSKRKKEALMRREPKKANYILFIEKLWEKYALNGRSAEALDNLLMELRDVISKKAEALEKRWTNKKIPAAEFEYEFWN
jgi:hypothetical protein